MSVLDELREMVTEEAQAGTDGAPRSAWMLAEDLLLLINAFEAKHPYLEDFTDECAYCGPSQLLDTRTAARVPVPEKYRHPAESEWCVCPACAKVLGRGKKP